jgi:dienelactone hydrolase
LGLVGQPGITQSTFPGTAYRDYSRCFPDYLRILAQQAYDLRNRALKKLTSSDDVRERQHWAREIFWKLSGSMPERTPLNARTVGSFERPGYRVDKVLYESRPRLLVSANLYIPTGATPPFPGVLFQMGHSLNGKAAGAYQRFCQGLAQLGYLVLAFDPIGQGERVYYPDVHGIRTRLGTAVDEHNMSGRQMLLVGETACGYQVWDAVRSLDYLAAHRLADPRRLAATGQSGGGTLTMLLLAADDRVQTAVVCDGNTENFACADFNPPGSTDDAEQNLVGSAPLGFDRWDLLYPFAPKPLLVLVSDRDAFDTYSPRYISNGWEEFTKLQRIYRMLGSEDHLRWADRSVHELSYDSRLQIYNWFNRWLKKEATPVTDEPPTRVEPDTTLWVAESGNVVRTFRSETPFTILKSSRPAQVPITPENLLELDPPLPKTGAAMLFRTPRRKVDVEVVEFQSGSLVWLPAWLFRPRTTNPANPLVIALDPAGRNARSHEGGLYESLASEGYVVCIPDLRGTGDLTPEFGRGAARYARDHAKEESYAWASLILGKPLVGQRVCDILAVLRAMVAHPVPKSGVIVAAQQKMTVPAQFAAMLSDRIRALYLAGGLVSYRSIIETEKYTEPFANFVPHIAEHTDLPEVTASLAPRRVILAGCVDGAGRTADVALVRQTYRAAGNVHITAEARWDVESLLDFARSWDINYGTGFR